MKKIMLSIALLFLALIFFNATSLGADLKQELGKEVSEIYIEKGSYFSVVPELIRQLEIRAVLELGSTPPPMLFRIRKEYEGRSFGDIHAPYFYSFNGNSKPLLEIGPYERKKGTVLEIVDDFCRLRKDFFWEVKDGILRIFKGPRKTTALTKFLEKPLGGMSFKNKVVDRQFLRGVEKNIEKEFPFVLNQLPTFIMRIATRGNLGFPHLSDTELTATLPAEKATFNEFMHSILASGPNYYWVVYESQPYDQAGFRAYLSNWSPVRKRLPLSDLLEGLNKDSTEKMHDYPNPRHRAEDFLREVNRRYHFNPRGVAEGIIKSGLVDKVITWGENESCEALRWLIALNNEHIMKLVIEKILACKDPKRKANFFRGGSTAAIPPPWDDKRFIHVWEKAAKDKSEDVRSEAKPTLETVKEYQAWLKKRLEAGMSSGK